MTFFLFTDIVWPEPRPGSAVGYFLLFGDTQSWKPSNNSEQHCHIYLTHTAAAVRVKIQLILQRHVAALQYRTGFSKTGEFNREVPRLLIA